MTDFEKMNQLLDLRTDLKRILKSKRHPDEALRRIGRASLSTADTLPHRRRAVAELQRRYRFDKARTSIQAAIRSLTSAIEGGTATKHPRRKRIDPTRSNPPRLTSREGMTDE